MIESVDRTLAKDSDIQTDPPPATPRSPLPDRCFSDGWVFCLVECMCAGWVGGGCVPVHEWPTVECVYKRKEEDDENRFGSPSFIF